MANIYRAIKIWNGSSWDYIYPSVCRSITFGLSGDSVQSSDAINFNAIIGNSYKFDSDASIAALNGDGGIKILKSGRYLISANIDIENSIPLAGGRLMVDIGKNISDVLTNRIIDQSAPTWASGLYFYFSACGMRSLNANTILYASINTGSGTRRVPRDATTLTVAFLGE